MDYQKDQIGQNLLLELKDGKSTDDENPISSKFIKTYLQSLEAENYGLDELAGMGFRKAIEYLVKDWAIQNNPDKKEKIIDSWLGVAIKGYYDGDLKEILERATWLGNDQAHYNRLFSEFDIDVLKELIDLIMVELNRQYKKGIHPSNYRSIFSSKWLGSSCSSFWIFQSGIFSSTYCNHCLGFISFALQLLKNEYSIALFCAALWEPANR